MNDQEYAYGRGYVDALMRVSDDVHQQAHQEQHKSGNQKDPRARAFFDLAKTLKDNAQLVKDDIEQRYLEANKDGESNTDL